MPTSRFCEETSPTYLNVNYPFWKGLFLFFLGGYKWIGDVGTRVSYQIKRKQERKRGGGQKKEENFTLFSYTRYYVLICSIH